jgi:hypothetical protein
VLDELMQYPNWILWKYVEVPGTVKLTKEPRTVDNGKASPANPAHWSDYATAYAAYMRGGFDGLGFVISDNTPYSCIDMDDPEGREDVITRQCAIVKAVDSYSEVSPSGKGLHIWVKGKVESNRLRKDSGVELYTRDHYMTITFRVYEDKPIAERQSLLQSLWEQMATKVGVVQAVRESVQIHSDLNIYQMACAGKNGQLFLDLWQGQWQNYRYPSASEGDFALVNILGFYSRNIEQIERMFMQSGMGHRYVTGEKRKSRNYLIKMVHRSFDNQVPEVDTAAIRMKMEAELIEQRAIASMKRVTAEDTKSTNWDLPPGLMGEIAKFIFQAAPHPFQEIALGGAIGLLAGIAGRGYNISGTGLNQYVVVIAGTGTGKEAAASGISKIMQQVCKPECVPAAVEFLGPSDISSGPALIKQLVDTPCFVSMMSEFGLTLQNLSSRSANSSAISFRKALLELFPRSGDSNFHRPTIYSDKSKNTTIIKSPNFSILAESTPEEFYKTVDEGVVAQGFLPRFTLLEYTGPRVHYNEAHEHVQPSAELLKQVADLCVYCLNIMRMGKANKIALDENANKMVVEFRTQVTNSVNAASLDVEKQLWSRAYLKMMKLAGLVAVGVDIYHPVVTPVMVAWAKRIVISDIGRLMERFNEGLVGLEQSEVNQREKVVREITKFIYKPVNDSMIKYGATQKMHENLVVPMGYLQKMLLSNGAFKNDRMGATNALSRALGNLCAEGCIQEMRAGTVATEYGKSGKVYQIIETSRFKR